MIDNSYGEAEIVTKGNSSLAEVIIVDKVTEWMRSAYRHEQDHDLK